jgi:tetratricopeptide (TPR) repeat protein
MNKALFGLLIVSMLLSSGGCGENAARLNDRAQKAFMAGDQAEAVSLFGRVLVLDPDNMDAHFYLGWIYKIQGKTDEAIAEFRKASAIQPNHGGTYNHLGDLYLARGMLDDAIEAYKKAVQFSPDAATGHYKLGVAYRRKGGAAEAADAFFEAGILAVVSNNKDIASNAYQQLQESGNTRLAAELREVLVPWFDPAGAAAAGDRGSRLPN